MKNSEKEVCGFCGSLDLAEDDCGYFYLWPDRGIEEGRLACWPCFRGDPGKRHQARYGVGDR